MESIPLGGGQTVSPFFVDFFQNGGRLKIVTVGRPSGSPAAFNPLIVVVGGYSYAIAATAEHAANPDFMAFLQAVAPGTAFGTTTCSMYASFALWSAAAQKVDRNLWGFILNPTSDAPMEFGINLFRMSQTVWLCVALGTPREALEDALDI